MQFFVREADVVKTLNFLDQEIQQKENGYRQMDLIHMYQGYTLRHRQAYLFTMIALGLQDMIDAADWEHDVEKLVAYAVLPKGEVSMQHRCFSRHHYPNTIEDRDILRAIIDYECARLTKPDKPLNAFETIQRYTPEAYETFRPILRNLGLDSSRILNLQVDLTTQEYNNYLSVLQEHGIAGIRTSNDLLVKYGIEHLIEQYNKALDQKIAYDK